MAGNLGLKKGLKKLPSKCARTALDTSKGFRGLGLGSGNIRVRTEKLGLGSAKLRVKMAGNIKVKWREI